MSDLSRLLGDVYGTSTAPPPEEGDGLAATTSTAAEAPDWADEEALDRAFEGWVAGPPEEAPAAERSMLAGLADQPPAPPAAVDEARVDEISRIVPVESLVGAGAATVDPAGDVADHTGDAALTADGAHDAPAALTVDAPVEVGQVADRPRAWERSADDILPRRGGARGLLRRR